MGLLPEERWRLAQSKMKRLRCRKRRRHAFQVNLLWYHKIPDNVVLLKKKGLKIDACVSINIDFVILAEAIEIEPATLSEKLQLVKLYIDIGRV